VGLPVERLTRYPGSAASWENSVLPGTTAFVVELPAAWLSRGAVKRYVQAILTLARAVH
jgi:protein MpaA